MLRPHHHPPTERKLHADNQSHEQEQECREPMIGPRRGVMAPGCILVYAVRACTCENNNHRYN